MFKIICVLLFDRNVPDVSWCIEQNLFREPKQGGLVVVGA